jgi:hypothetical protein
LFEEQAGKIIGEKNGKENGPTGMWEKMQEFEKREKLLLSVNNNNTSR